MRAHCALPIVILSLTLSLALGDRELPRPERVIEVLRSGDFVAR